MKQKDYERAAEMIRNRCENDHHGVTDTVVELAHARRPCLRRACIVQGECIISLIEDMFVEFFQENPKFDEKRFREACMRRCDRLERKWGKPCTKHEDHDGKCNS